VLFYISSCNFNPADAVLHQQLSLYFCRCCFTSEAVELCFRRYCLTLAAAAANVKQQATTGCSCLTIPAAFIHTSAATAAAAVSPKSSSASTIAAAGAAKKQSEKWRPSTAAETTTAKKEQGQLQEMGNIVETGGIFICVFFVSNGRVLHLNVYLEKENCQACFQQLRY